MSFLILVCERCIEDGVFKSGVYRDLRGQTLCDPCDTDLERQQQAMRGDYGRQMEPVGEVRRKRERFRGAA